MSHRPALALALSAALLAGCSGAGAVRDDRGDADHAIDMTPYLERDDRREDEGDGGSLERCGDPDDARELQLSTAGAEVEVVVPAEADGDAVGDLEDYRADAGAAPVCWVVVAVDNSRGDEVVDLPRVEVVAADGQRVRLQRASEALAAWADLRPDDDAAATRAVELTASSDGVVGPGDEGEVVFVADADLDGARDARVQLGEGGALVEATG
ncbi:hypothetical protein [uncultured Pseudokineococcus sp.]|uniref:hypothetical protein n=1 Tax=uncultured Pseudokineococcus sp. TaxID=1642928 RepID=UPI00261BE461|nr:hypothetical protein [uncultured Pseudokineococcus sp.]